jgi:ATP/maltotriose-dependent transcriptional regulator MalT
MLETALSRLKPSDERLRAQCLSAAAVAASYLGQIEKTVEYGKRALQILDRTGPPIFAAMTRDHLARVLEQAGRDDEAKRLRQEAHTDMDTADAALRNWDERYGRRTRKWWQFWK